MFLTLLDKTRNTVFIVPLLWMGTGHFTLAVWCPPGIAMEILLAIRS